MPSKAFDDSKLKRLLKRHLPLTVMDMGLGAGEKVGGKGEKVVDPTVRAAFCERVGTISSHFLG